MNSLSDIQISKLTMQQIQNLSKEPPIYSKVPWFKMDDVLNTQWLFPQASYKKGDYFGERALTHPNEPRGGTAICTKACRLAFMSRSTYEELLLRM